MLEQVIDAGGLGLTHLFDVRPNRATLDVLASSVLDGVRFVELTTAQHLFPQVLVKLKEETAFARVLRHVSIHFTTAGPLSCEALAVDAWAGLRVASLRVNELRLERAALATTVTFGRLAEPGDHRLYRGDSGPDFFFARALSQNVPGLERVVFDGPPPSVDAVRHVRAVLPRVECVMADGRDPLAAAEAHEREFPRPAPPPPTPVDFDEDQAFGEGDFL